MSDMQSVGVVQSKEEVLEPLIHYRGYIPSLDGMRGVAILAVMVLHFFPEAIWKEYCPYLGPVLNKVAQMGFIGVELFFVLSGFLITGILLDAKEKGVKRNYLSNFYKRRIVRIYPLYYGALLLVLFLLPVFINFDEAAKQIFNQQWRLWLNLTNFPINIPDWDGSQLFLVGHFWFLAVQEQFYLIWPFIIFACSRRALLRVCVIFMLVGHFARFSNVIGGDNSIWFFQWSTISKIDGLVLGALLSILIRRHEYHKKIYFFARCGFWFFGPLLLVIMFVPRRIMNSFGDRGMIFLEPILVFFFASLLILVLNRKTGISKRMCNPALLWFGKYSYGLYIIHGLLRPAHVKILLPDMFVSFFRIPAIGLLMHLATCIAISMILAYASWHCYEKHFLKLKKYFAYN